MTDNITTIDIEQAEDIEPMVDVFDKAKEGFLLIAKTQLGVAEREDNTANIRDFCRKFFGDERYFQEEIRNDLNMVYELQDLSIETYSKIVEIAEHWTLEDFSKETIEDFFLPLRMTREDIDNNPRELCKACLIFLSIRPYADKMLHMHQLIQDEMAKRGLEPTEE